MTAQPFLSTKLHIPAARPRLIERPRLLDFITDGITNGHRLTLISAPAGFGKTTLISDWSSQQDSPCAWLSIDEEDNDPRRFTAYISAALQRAYQDSGEPYQAGDDEHPPEAVITGIINRLFEWNTPLTLVLDDLHLVRNFAVYDLLAYLIENQPPDFHIIISTREDPPLPLPRWRARSHITEIRERMLRFTQEETAAFFSNTIGIDLAQTAITALEARTEGWITGLQLAGVALRTQSPDKFIAEFSGDDRYIMDYLMAEVLEREPENVCDFLRSTSILDRMCAPLCHRLTGHENAQEMLEHLESANLFVIPLDNRREWYRYHGLFADVLRLTLSDDALGRLHHAAAEWLAENGHEHLSVNHARQAEKLGNPQTSRRERGQDTLIEPLSEREVEVLILIATGYSNAEIARTLYIALGTVKRHINNLYGKLEVGSRTQAVAKAREIGLID